MNVKAVLGSYTVHELLRQLIEYLQSVIWLGSAMSCWKCINFLALQVHTCTRDSPIKSTLTATSSSTKQNVQSTNCLSNHNTNIHTEWHKIIQ